MNAWFDLRFFYFLSTPSFNYDDHFTYGKIMSCAGECSEKYSNMHMCIPVWWLKPVPIIISQSVSQCLRAPLVLETEFC